MRLERLVALGLLALIFNFVLAWPAQAYLDPGSGSFIIQMIIAGLMGSLFMLKIYWKKIRSFFGGKSQEVGEDE